MDYQQLFLHYCSIADVENAAYYARASRIGVWREALYNACKNNRLPIVRLLQRISSESIMYAVCKSGNIVLIKLFIDEFTNDDKNHTLDWVQGFYGACRGGYANIALAMVRLSGIIPGYVPQDIQRLPPYRQLEYYRNIKPNIGFIEACKGGHLELARLLYPACPGSKFEAACIGYEYNHVNIIKEYISKAREVCSTYICKACRGGNIELVKTLLTHIHEADQFDLNRWLRIACEHGHEHIAMLMIEYGATDFPVAFAFACRSKSPELAKGMLSRCTADNYVHALQCGLQAACVNNPYIDPIFLQYLLESYKDVYRPEIEKFILQSLDKSFNIRALKILLDYGIISIDCLYPQHVAALLDHGIDIARFSGNPKFHLELARLQTLRQLRSDVIYEDIGLPQVIADLIVRYEGFFKNRGQELICHLTSIFDWF